MYAPVSSSLCQQFTAWLTCTPPEFFETNFIAQGKGREVTRVRSNGCIKVVFNITTKNMNDWGYQNSKERVDPTENFDRQQTQFFAKGPQSGPQMNASMRSRSKKERLSTLEKEKRLQKKKRPSARDRSDSEDMYGDGFKTGEGYSSSASKQRRGDRAEPGSSLKHRVSGRNRRDDSDLDSFGGVGDHKMATGEFSKRSSSKKGRRDY
jgi:hypothetical protein